MFTTPVWGESANKSDITFSCQDERGIPNTIAKNKQGKTQTVFYWNKDIFPDTSDTLELCNNVSEKLNNYTAEGKDLSLFVLQANEQIGLPTVCATETGVDCDLVLFTLAPTEEPIYTAGETLRGILHQEVSETSLHATRNNQLKQLFSINLFPNEE